MEVKEVEGKVTIVYSPFERALGELLSGSVPSSRLPYYKQWWWPRVEELKELLMKEILWERLK